MTQTQAIMLILCVGVLAVALLIAGFANPTAWIAAAALGVALTGWVAYKD